MGGARCGARTWWSIWLRLFQIDVNLRGTRQVVGRRPLGEDAAEQAAEPAYQVGATDLDNRKLVLLRSLLLRLWDSYELPPNPLDRARRCPCRCSQARGVPQDIVLRSTGALMSLLCR